MKDTIEKEVSVHFIVCKDLSIDEVGEGVEGHRIPGVTVVIIGAGFITNRRFR